MLFTTILPFLLPLAYALPTPSDVDSEAEPASYNIRDVQFSGSACPQGSNGASFAGGLTTSTVNFKQFRASDGSSENCQLHFQGENVTPGWQVALQEVQGVGSVSLKQGSSVSSYVTSFWSQDAKATSTLSNTITNPQAGNYEKDFAVTSKASSPAWSKCVGSDGYLGIINVNFRLALNGNGNFNLNKENLKFVWRRC